MAKDKKKKTGKIKGKVDAGVETFKTLSNNKLVADVVAAALVATAAALKDSDKAKRFAAEAGDQLEKLSKESAQRGSAMWQLALDIGRRALDSVGSEAPPKRAKAKSGAAKLSDAKAAKPAKPAAPRKAASAKSKAKRPTKKA
jgi:hypothetical protein